MRTECPSCSASYDIPDHLLVKGRKTRCARCGRDWVPVPSDAVTRTVAKDAGSSTAVHTAPSDHEAEDEVRKAERLSITSQPPTAPLALKAAWGASIAALALLAVGTIVWRDSVVRFWPASQHVLGGAASVRPHQ